MPRLFSTATCALRIFDAATIFMALVILPMFLMARMRCFTAGRNRGEAATAQNTSTTCLGSLATAAHRPNPVVRCSPHRPNPGPYNSPACPDAWRTPLTAPDLREKPRSANAATHTAAAAKAPFSPGLTHPNSSEVAPPRLASSGAAASCRSSEPAPCLKAILPPAAAAALDGVAGVGIAARYYSRDTVVSSELLPVVCLWEGVWVGWRFSCSGTDGSFPDSQCVYEGGHRQ